MSTASRPICSTAILAALLGLFLIAGGLVGVDLWIFALPVLVIAIFLVGINFQSSAQWTERALLGLGAASLFASLVAFFGPNLTAAALFLLAGIAAIAALHFSVR